ncbi:SlyX family protein [Aureimonas leprariae]|uniref:SlyX family protein n=1 Tax=Plantimonas leprariae TaxID=2615207 RepID=A0A7V7U1W1_9HYPH|nr:SlyX family protein [Aureimonas leprariae]KAB0682718.1 SlyX family protein [Aureimonas leprariae]
MSDERIRHLEETIAHQSIAIEDLSEEVRRQGLLIDELQRSIRLLAERFASVEAALPAPEITKPPHY